MNYLHVGSSKGQIKIQQMAFILVALMIFFSIALLIFMTFRLSGIRESAFELREAEARETVRKISSTPEFSFTSDCSSCIDLDKVLILKDRKSYEGFWDFDYLQIEKIYPKYEGECDKFTYPDCRTITIIEKEDFGTPVEAFVSLCRWEESQEGYFKCELGKIYISGENIRQNEE
jgi:hypothetical protein